LFEATEEVLRDDDDDVTVRDEVVRETGDADAFVDDGCYSAVDEVARLSTVVDDSFLVVGGLSRVVDTIDA
jgi:hypothetical protein